MTTTRQQPPSSVSPRGPLSRYPQEPAPGWPPFPAPLPQTLVWTNTEPAVHSSARPHTPAPSLRPPPPATRSPLRPAQPRQTPPSPREPPIHPRPPPWPRAPPPPRLGSAAMPLPRPVADICPAAATTAQHPRSTAPRPPARPLPLPHHHCCRSASPPPARPILLRLLPRDSRLSGRAGLCLSLRLHHRGQRRIYHRILASLPPRPCRPQEGEPKQTAKTTEHPRLSSRSRASSTATLQPLHSHAPARSSPLPVPPPWPTRRHPPCHCYAPPHPAN